MSEFGTHSRLPAAGILTDPLALSALNDFLFCPRRAGLKFIEGLRGTNEHTVIGDLAHENVDKPGYEQRAGWELLRALPLFSDKLGLTGKADLVEVQRNVTGVISVAHPIEYKKGPARRFDNDEVQLCAQALCLEEMLGITVADGAIYHVASARRAEIIFDSVLRDRTLCAILDLKALVSNSKIPPGELKPQCEGCSLHSVCLPEAIGRRSTALFQPRTYV